MVRHIRYNGILHCASAFPPSMTSCVCATHPKVQCRRAEWRYMAQVTLFLPLLYTPWQCFTWQVVLAMAALLQVVAVLSVALGAGVWQWNVVIGELLSMPYYMFCAVWVPRWLSWAVWWCRSDYTVFRPCLPTSSWIGLWVSRGAWIVVYIWFLLILKHLTECTRQYGAYAECMMSCFSCCVRFWRIYVYNTHHLSTRVGSRNVWNIAWLRQFTSHSIFGLE